jgi:plasmid stabilization system protein ParE
MKWLLAPGAEAEPAEAANFNGSQASRSVALAFLAEFERVATLLSTNPGIGTPTYRGRQLMPLRRFPYSAIYREDGDCIRIGAVAQHSRRPGYWRKRS